MEMASLVRDIAHSNDILPGLIALPCKMDYYSALERSPAHEGASVISAQFIFPNLCH